VQLAYAALGVTPEAEEHIVKAAYKAAAKRIHSDHGGQDKAMATLNAAMGLVKQHRGWK
jgi:DnaJ-class molecular chaperone